MTKIFISIVFISLLVISCGTNDTSKNFPIPTKGDTKIANFQDEEGGSFSKRKAWLKLMHGADTSIYKQKIFDLSKKYARKQNIVNRNNQEEIVPGLFRGTWHERGSLNQAGSVIALDYVKKLDEIFLIGAGGSIFRGPRSGNEWSIVNQDFIFNSNFIKVFPYKDSYRILALINNSLNFSDDFGKTWTKASGLQTDLSNALISKAISIEKEDTIITYILFQEDYYSNYEIMVSLDNGESIEIIKSFKPQTYSVEMEQLLGTDRVFFMQIDNGFSFYELIGDTISQVDNFTKPKNSNSGTFNMVKIEDEIRINFFNKKNKVYKSTDLGQTWNSSGKLPEFPWITYTSKFKKNFVVMGAVELFKSTSGGGFWQKQNEWWEYYDEVDTKIHADIMNVKEFETVDGKKFMLVANHGGLSISYNNLKTISNLGLENLNVGQFYDIATSVRHNRLFIGTQDQGLLESEAESDSKHVIPMDQSISGDYGHIYFTGTEKEDVWYVYPGGAISTGDMISGNYGFYTIESEDESVWIPPLTSTLEEDASAIYAAGGAKDGGSGSYILRLEVNNWGNISVTQLPFDFMDRSNGAVSCIAVSPIDNNVIFAGTTTGFFFYSTDKGQTWTQSILSKPNGHYLYGSTILPSKTNVNEVWVGGSGYNGGAIIFSTDMGSTFTTFEEGLDGTLVFGLESNQDESQLYAATETGPYVYLKETGRWYSMLGGAAPYQTYWSVEYIEEQDRIRFGTYGRGMWDFQIEQFPVSNKEIVDNTNVEIGIFPNPTKDFVHIDLSQLKSKGLSIKIFDMAGKTVLSEKEINNNILKINVQNWKKGNYTISIQGKELLMTKKLVVN